MENQEPATSFLKSTLSNAMAFLKEMTTAGKGPTLTGISAFLVVLAFVYGGAYLYSYYFIGLGIPIFSLMDVSEIIQYAISSLITITLIGISTIISIGLLTNAVLNNNRFYKIMATFIIALIAIGIAAYIYHIYEAEPFTYFINLLSLKLLQVLILLTFFLLLLFLFNSINTFTSYSLFLTVVSFYVLLAFSNASISKAEILFSSKAAPFSIHINQQTKVKSSSKMKYLGRTKNYLFFKIGNDWKRIYSLDKETIYDFK